MPPYDPKANRPKLVPVDGDPAPVDALLGPTDAAAPADVAAPAPQRAHLSVVAPDERAPRAAEPPVVESASRRPDAKVLVAVAAIAIAVVGVVVAARRRSH